MSHEKPLVTFAYDMDGLLVKAPRLSAEIHKVFIQPYVEGGTGHKKNSLTRSIDRIQVAFYDSQQPTEDSLKLVQAVNKIAEANGKSTRNIILSRRPDRHLGATRNKLCEIGILPFIDEIHLLGENKNLAVINGHVMKLIYDGSDVVFMEDDTSLALGVARRFDFSGRDDTPEVLVYKPKNVAVELFQSTRKNYPDNFVVADDTEHLIVDFGIRVQSGRF